MLLKLLSFLLLCLGFAIRVQGAKTYSWYITVHTNDCIDCLNGLNLIKNLDRKYPKIIIFKKENRSDSADLVKRLFLKDFKGKIIFNDRLFNRFKSGSAQYRSSVTLFNNQNGIFVSEPLVALLDTNYYFQRYLRPKDTFDFKDNVFKSTSLYHYTADKAYLLDQISGVLSIYNRTDFKKVCEISLDSATILKGYTVRYGKEEGYAVYRQAMDFINKNHVIGGGTRIVSLHASGDTFRIVAYQPVLGPVSRTTGQAIQSIQTMYTYVNSELVHVDNIENYLNDQYQQHPGIKRELNLPKSAPNRNNNAYFVGTEFFFYRDTLYNSLFSSYVVVNMPNQDWARFKNPTGNQWIFDKFEGHLPERNITSGHNYNFQHSTTGTTHFGSYFADLLSDTLFSVNPKFKPIPINFVFDKTPASFHKIKTSYLCDFKLNKGYLYLLVQQGDGNGQYVYRYFKYDLKSRKVLFSKAFPHYYYYIDPFDYEYVIGNIGTKYIRMKVGD